MHMGRLLGYLGPETIIAHPVEGGSYSLAHQAEECPDGFGLGWYPRPVGAPPLRVRSATSIRSSDHILEVPRHYRSECVLASVRSGGPGTLSGLAPFRTGKHLFAFDGRLERFEEVFQRPLAQGLSAERFARLEGLSAAELIFAAWADALDDAGDEGAMADALEQVVGQVQALATDADASAALTVIATNGEAMLALRTATHGAPPPLYTTVAEDRAPIPATGRIIATEPTFPGQWTTLDAHALTIYAVERDEEASATLTPA